MFCKCYNLPSEKPCKSIAYCLSSMHLLGIFLFVGKEINIFFLPIMIFSMLANLPYNLPFNLPPQSNSTIVMQPFMLANLLLVYNPSTKIQCDAIQHNIHTSKVPIAYCVHSSSSVCMHIHTYHIHVSAEWVKLIYMQSMYLQKGFHKEFFLGTCWSLRTISNKKFSKLDCMCTHWKEIS